MTNEQMNTAIARALNADEHWMIQKNYCTDLNAMHEAEKSMWRKDYYMRHEYIAALGTVLNPHNPGRLEASDMLDVTARQRAEAFLRTLGKWEEAE
jgi:hypothetical protein